MSSSGERSILGSGSIDEREADDAVYTSNIISCLALKPNDSSMGRS